MRKFFNHISLIVAVVLIMLAFAMPASSEQLTLDEPALVLTIEKIPIVAIEPASDGEPQLVTVSEIYVLTVTTQDQSYLPTDYQHQVAPQVRNASYIYSLEEVPKQATLSHSVDGFAQTSVTGYKYIDPGDYTETMYQVPDI